MTNETKAAKPQAAIQAPSDWMIVDSLLYRLNEFGVNCDEINVTMADGSRKESPRAKRAKQLLAALAPAIQAQPLTDADIANLFEANRSMFDFARAIERHLSGQVAVLNPLATWPGRSACAASPCRAVEPWPIGQASGVPSGLT